MLFRSSLVEEAGRLRMDLRSEIQADVESSVGFDASATAHFQNYLQKQTKKNVILRFKEDPSILSGFRAKVGNVVYDFTLDNAIKNLKLSFN